MRENKTISEQIRNYETALAESGLGHSARLNLLQRAGGLVRTHECQGFEYLNSEVTAEYFRSMDEQFYSGHWKQNHYQTKRRMAERFLHFAETGEIHLPNTLKGCRQKLSKTFDEIAEAFIATIHHPNTRNDARWVAHKYFAWLEEQGYSDLYGVGSVQIRQYLLTAAKKYSQNSMRNVKLYLSKLYEYLHKRGLSESPYHELLSFPVNHSVRVQPVLPKSDIAKMLNTIDRRTIGGKRAYAVMMLGTVLGLRACDVANMKLSDIDWVNGEIKLLQSKTSNPVVLPLTEDVGAAIQDYILNGRPQSDSKQVFLRLLAPFTELKNAVTIGEIFRDCCKAAGIPASKRFHSLRRSLATSMVNAGIPVYDVAQALGDVNIDSTKQYIEVDTIHLKLCALPFDGIAVKGGESI